MGSIPTRPTINIQQLITIAEADEMGRVGRLGAPFERVADGRCCNLRLEPRDEIAFQRAQIPACANRLRVTGALIA